MRSTTLSAGGVCCCLGQECHYYSTVNMEGRSHLFSNVYPNVVSDMANLDLEEEELPEEGAEGGDICIENDGEDLLSALEEMKRQAETEQRAPPSATWKTPATPRKQEPATASNPNQLQLSTT